MAISAHILDHCEVARSRARKATAHMPMRRLHDSWVQRIVGVVAPHQAEHMGDAGRVAGAGPAQHQAIAEIAAVVGIRERAI
jgi:hypothetical protein